MKKGEGGVGTQSTSTVVGRMDQIHFGVRAVVGVRLNIILLTCGFESLVAEFVGTSKNLGVAMGVMKTALLVKIFYGLSVCVLRYA